jgi:hypothetical protein
MAIFDNLLTLVGYVDPTGKIVPQLITAIGAIVGTNQIDMNPSLGAANGGSVCESLDVTVSIVQTLTSAGAATVQFQLVQADDALLTSNVQVLNQTEALAFALLTAGTRVPLTWSRTAPYVPKRYFGMRVVIAGAALTNALPQFFAAVGNNFHDSPRIFNSGIQVA